MDERRIKGLGWKLGLTNMIVKDCVGRSGGLAIFWRKGINVHVRGILCLYIDADVTKEDGFSVEIHWFLRGTGRGKQELVMTSFAHSSCSSPAAMALYG